MTIGCQRKNLRFNGFYHVPITSFDEEQRRRLLNGIIRWHGKVPVAPEVYTTLGARQATDMSEQYTRLWLKLLEAAGEAPAATGALSHGDRLGPFKIVERMETGGQANVYKARVVDPTVSDVALPPGAEEVALKEFILSSVDSSARYLSSADFENECMLLSRFNCSANIIRLYDVMVENQRAYLVLEYVKGESVRRLVERRGPLSYADAIRIALGELHAQSFVHRDVSPENIVVNLPSTIKLLDFSLAVRVGPPTEQVVGKQAYLSPEQFRGEIDPRNDIYALGGTLYFMLTGQEPEAIQQQRLLAALPDAPPAIAEIIARCTELEAKDRYKNVAELRQALSAARQALAVDDWLCD